VGRRRSAGLACRSYLLQPCTESGCVASLEWCAAVALQSSCVPRGWRSDDFAMRTGSLCGCTDDFGASSECADETRCNFGFLKCVCAGPQIWTKKLYIAAQGALAAPICR